MSVLRTEVDGVPTLFAERTDGHVTGGLVFRVGWADENLAVRGLTHVVAHLAMTGLVEDVHRYVDTHATYTQFRAQGTAQSVSHVLSGLCTAFSELPVDGLEPEKELVLAEADGRHRVPRPDALYRYGASSHGLCAYPETGVPAIGPDLVRVWAAEAFTRGNVVLWLSADRLPAGLRLPLPEGPRLPPPAGADSRTPTPAWYRSPDPDLLTVTGVVPRSPASVVFTDVLGAALHREVCEEHALSHAAGAVLTVRDADSAVVTVTADSHPGERAGVTGGFVDVLARLRWGALLDEEVAAAARAAADQVSRAAADHETVSARAVGELLGIPHPEPDEHAAALAAVGPDDVRACAEAFAASSLAGVADRGLGWAGWAAAPLSSPHELDGRTYPGRDGHGTALVVADEGVSVVGPGLRSTVRYADLVLMTSYADGGRHLVGGDGFGVEVEPTLFAIDGAALARIDEAVDLARVVRAPARAAQDLPQPRPAEPDPPAPVPPPAVPHAAPDLTPAASRPGWRDRLPRLGRRSS
ncbi:peptidase M16 family protein [Phycicoccus flavus]|uniref:Insulinase family protein n=1 Tax=Phycicoccus flavus TaxID=2502783 RepID=A0A8T6R6U6_9MICO|nr:insulinase family protein [Phycicoccus flavus]NHA69180.1 insulinase family protein [Phycicoccus flavus]